MKRPGSRLARRGEMRRSPIKRGGPIKARRRPASDFARIYGSKARVRWVKHLPCVACIAASPFFGRTDGSSHNAHTETGGTGYKAGYATIVPFCASHHRRYDEHRAPFDTEDARQAAKDYAVVVESAWQALVQAGALTQRTP